MRNLAPSALKILIMIVGYMKMTHAQSLNQSTCESLIRAEKRREQSKIRKGDGGGGGGGGGGGVGGRGGVGGGVGGGGEERTE